MQIAYDPAEISLNTLLDMFWAGHDPFYGKGSQYRAELWCSTPEELTIAQQSARKIAEREGSPVATRVLPNTVFHPAEDYHQKWKLRRNERLFAALLKNYASEAELLASTAAAKLNAFESGHWSPGESGFKDIGLSPKFDAEGGIRVGR